MEIKQRHELNFGDEISYNYSIYHIERPDEIYVFNELSEGIHIFESFDENAILIALTDILNIIENNEDKFNERYFKAEE